MKEISVSSADALSSRSLLKMHNDEEAHSA